MEMVACLLMAPPLCCTGTLSLWVCVCTHTHTHGEGSILLVLSPSLEPRIIAATHSGVWALSFVPLAIFRWSEAWPNRMQTHSESQRTALSKLWSYIKRKGSRADFTKATSSPMSKWGTCSSPEEMGIWFREICLLMCRGLLGNV